MSPLDYALHPHNPRPTTRTERYTSFVQHGLLHYQTQCQHHLSTQALSIVSTTIVIFVVLTFNIALVLLNLYATVNCEI